ncbi:MAG: DUF4870 domain-containing protein [Clostridiaceae bacterium]|nr:DUF4870 domain-containing protein [Clostridiaceae bacterium]
MVTLKEKIISIGGYLLALFFPIPLLNIIAVQVYWMNFRAKSKFVDHHLKQNINFLITYQIYMLSIFTFLFLLDKMPISIVPGIVSIASVLLGFGSLGVLLLLFLLIYPIYIVAIIATLAGKYFKFPLTIKFRT